MFQGETRQSIAESTSISLKATFKNNLNIPQIDQKNIRPPSSFISNDLNFD